MKLFSRNGKLWVTFYHKSKRLRRSLKLDDTKQNRKLATNKIIPELVYKLNSGEFFKNEDNQVPTVGEFAKKSFAIHKPNRKESTQYGYIKAYNKHIKPYFENIRLDKVKPSDIALWQSKVLEVVSIRRLLNTRIILNIIFEDAINDEIIEKNPMTRVKTPKKPRIEIYPFSMREVKMILDSSDGFYKVFYAIGFFTGMRTGEIIGLKWEDIDFEKREITIKRSIRMGKISTPKTQNSYRVIDLLDPLIPYLKEQKKRTFHKNSFIFLTCHDTNLFDGKFIREKHWKNTLKKLNLFYRPLYHMRHTFATIMIENGEDILWVSNMLGHKDSNITLSTYARYIKRENRQRATFLSAIF